MRGPSLMASSSAFRHPQSYACLMAREPSSTPHCHPRRSNRHGQRMRSFPSGRSQHLSSYLPHSGTCSCLPAASSTAAGPDDGRQAGPLKYHIPDETLIMRSDSSAPASCPDGPGAMAAPRSPRCTRSVRHPELSWRPPGTEGQEWRASAQSRRPLHNPAGW